ncbi:uncharacterized protein LOC113387956 isoform X2 [Ctenocephalides felis]|nr:uncharacterized protein LOC113387956 isoform X2 [Ctenocephalides felis]
MADEALKFGQDGQPLPSGEELLKMLEGMDMSEEDKQSLRDSLLQQANRAASQDPTGATGVTFQQVLFMLAMVAIIVSVFAFFANKLYKSLTYKDRMREEKRKAKEERKNKEKKKVK